jgi:hypothetical protein
MRRNNSTRVFLEPSEGKRDYFKLVPRDCKIIIFSYLDYYAVTNLPIICKEWSEIVKASSATLFKMLCFHLWEVRVPEERAIDWKQSYIDIGKSRQIMHLICLSKNRRSDFSVRNRLANCGKRSFCYRSHFLTSSRLSLL